MQCAWLATVLPGACVPSGWLTALRSGVAGDEAHLADGGSRDSPSCGDSGEVEELHRCGASSRSDRDAKGVKIVYSQFNETNDLRIVNLCSPSKTGRDVRASGQG